MSTIKPHFTPALRAGDFIFISGQLPFDEQKKIVGDGIEAQTRVVIHNIERALLAALELEVVALALLLDPR